MPKTQKRRNKAGNEGRHNPYTPAIPTRVYPYTQWGIPKDSGGTPVASGAVFTIRVNKGNSTTTAVYPDSLDLHALYGAGFKGTDFVDSSVWAHFDYFRIVKVTYWATLINDTYFSYSQGHPKGNNLCVEVWSSVDYDDASTPASVTSFMRRQNKDRAVLTRFAPSRQIISFVPRRRISSNVDPSQQIVTPPKEWCDVKQIDKLIFGNVKWCFIAPGGNLGFNADPSPSSVDDKASYPNVKIHAVAELEFKGKQ